MAIPTLFATLNAATGAELDANFAALGALTPIPCTVAGTNTLVLTPAANTPSLAVYSNYGVFIGIAAATNTGAVTAAIGSLPPLPVYKDTTAGPVALAGGEIVIENAVWVMYDSALNSGTGGFHLLNEPPTVTVSGSPTSGQIAVWGTGGAIGGVAVTGTGNVVLAAGATITPASVATAALQTTTAYTVATLPAASAGLKGSRAFVTDASVATASIGAAITGSGSNVMPVFCNGTAWVYG